MVAAFRPSAQKIIVLKKESEKLFDTSDLFLNLRALLRRLAHGVTGNTSDFGSEESRFEP